MRIRAVLAAIACCSVLAAAAAAEDERDALKPYVACEFSDGLRIVSAARLPAEVKSRSVRTAAGRKSVSSIDGYRMVLGYPDTEPFANLRAELSAPGRYAADKAAIVEQMHFIAGAGAGTPAPIKHDDYRGFDHYRLDDLTMQHSPIAMHTFFSDARQVVLTIYFLNAAPARRKFASMEEFRQLRDRFLERYFECVRRNGG